jgi:hypothetical protein
MIRRGKTTVYDGDDIARAFNRPLPSTVCASCGHRRGDHRREVMKPGMFDGIEAHHECERWNGRWKIGDCPCEQFTEPEGDDQ